MNPGTTINIFLLIFALAVAENSFSHGDDEDDVVRCKHCQHSLELCSYLKSCERYRPDNQQGAISETQASADENNKMGWTRGSGVISIFPEAGITTGFSLSRPLNKVLNIVEQLRLPDHIVDFLQVTTKESISEEPITIEPLTFPQSEEVVEINAEGIDILPSESTEIPVLITGGTVEAVKLDDDPIFVHFEQNMLVLDYTFPGEQLADLLLHLNMSAELAHQAVISVASSVFSGLGGQVYAPVDFNIESQPNGGYLLLAHDRDSGEWFTAIVIVYKKYALLFLLDEARTLKTLVSSTATFRRELNKLAGFSLQPACSIEYTSDYEMFLHPLEFSIPAVNAVTLEAAIAEYKAQKQEGKMEVTGPVATTAATYIF